MNASHRPRLAVATLELLVAISILVAAITLFSRLVFWHSVQSRLQQQTFQLQVRAENVAALFEQVGEIQLEMLQDTAGDDLQISLETMDVRGRTGTHLVVRSNQVPMVRLDRWRWDDE